MTLLTDADRAAIKAAMIEVAATHPRGHAEGYAAACTAAFIAGKAAGRPEAIAEAAREAAKLRQQVWLQRRELRRLNKVLGPYWRGFHRGISMEAECRLRGIMNATFGHKAVRAAEVAAIKRLAD